MRFRPVARLLLVVGLAATTLQAQSNVQTPAQNSSPAAAAPQNAPAPATPSTPSSSPAATPTPSSQDTKAQQDNKKKPADEIKTGKPIQANTLHAQRKAAKLYLAGVKLLEKQQPQAAWNLLKQAVELVPDNVTYAKAAELARQSAVTQLVQESSRERIKGGPTDAAKLLQQAQAIDATNPLVVEHLDLLAKDTANAKVGNTANAAMGAQAGISEGQDTLADGPIVLQPKQEKHSFHLRSNTRQVLQDVFRAYGIEASVHDSVQARPVRLDIDDATFPEATRALAMLTQTFYEPLDPHRVIVAWRRGRTGSSSSVSNGDHLSARAEREGACGSQQLWPRMSSRRSRRVVEPNSGRSLTIRAYRRRRWTAFNSTMAQLEDGKSEVAVNVKVIQLSHIGRSRDRRDVFSADGRVQRLF